MTLCDRKLGSVLGFKLGLALFGWSLFSLKPTHAELIPPSTQAIVQLQGLKLPPPQTQGSTVLPLKSPAQSKLLTIEGTLKQQTESFLVDTGASTTLISATLAHRLGLQGQKIAGDRLASAVAGENCPSMDAHLHQLPALSLGSMQVQNLRGLEFVNAQIPHGLSGVLGMNLLSAFDLQINPVKGQLALTPPTTLPPDQRSQILPLQRKLGVMLAQIRVNGQGPFTFLLDTGAASTFVSPRVAQLAHLTHRPRQAVQVRGFCGLEAAYRVITPQLQLGIHGVQSIDTIVLDSSVIQTLKVDGILGQNVLGQFHQHWRFPSSSLPDQQAQGSLLLIPVALSKP